MNFNQYYDVQGYPKRMRLQRGFYGVYSFFFLDSWFLTAANLIFCPRPFNISCKDFIHGTIQPSGPCIYRVLGPH